METMMSMETKLPPTQQAALDRLKKDGEVRWSGTTAIETRALNALMEKGLVMKPAGSSTYKLVPQ